MKRIAALLCLCLLTAVSHVRADDVIVINDIESWRHPTKDVLARYKIALKKVELRHKRIYPVFFVEMPWDPRASPNAKLMRQLEMDLLSANGYHDYALNVDPDRIVIEIRWDKGTRTLYEAIAR